MSNEKYIHNSTVTTTKSNIHLSSQVVTVQEGHFKKGDTKNSPIDYLGSCSIKSAGLEDFIAILQQRSNEKYCQK